MWTRVAATETVPASVCDQGQKQGWTTACSRSTFCSVSLCKVSDVCLQNVPATSWSSPFSPSSFSGHLPSDTPSPHSVSPSVGPPRAWMGGRSTEPGVRTLGRALLPTNCATSSHLNFLYLGFSVICLSIIYISIFLINSLELQ